MLRRPYVAVVDDDEGMCRALRRLLHSSQMDVATFYTGGEILRSIQQNPPDCIVMDVELPDFKSLDLFDRLHRAHPTVPVIVITAWEDDTLRDRALASGATGFFYKPFSDQEFLGTMQRAMDEASALAGTLPPPDGNHDLRSSG
jgi:FixJ family two-component response regulator